MVVFVPTGRLRNMVTAKRATKSWSGQAEENICFESVDGLGQIQGFNRSARLVTDFITKYVDMYIQIKTFPVCPNQKH